MSAIDALNVVVDLSTKAVINVGVIYFFLVVPESRCLEVQSCPLELFCQVSILRFSVVSVKVLVDAVEEFLHEFVGVLLLPIDKKHTYFG